MNVTVYTFIFMSIGIWCLLGSPRRTLIVMIAITPFAAVSALDLPALGGASISPANFFLIFFAIRLLLMPDGVRILLSQVTPRRALSIFAILTLWVVSSSILLPRLFDGQTHVFSLARTESGDGVPVPLHPSSGNISQAIYAIGDFVIAVAASAFARGRGGFGAAFAGLMIATGLHLLFGCLDLVTAATGTSSLLDIVHTANYALLTSDTAAGLKRVSGTFTEASGFATYSLLLLGANFTLFLNNIRPIVSGLNSLALTIFIVLSTSSAGYAGLGAFYAMFFLYALYCAIFGPRRPVVIAASIAFGGALCAAAVMLFLPNVVTVAFNVLSEVVFNKSVSDSAIERGSWNAQALQVFWDTAGAGAGAGSTRASNYILLLLSNFGILGLVLFALLMGWLAFSPASPHLNRQDRAMTLAARTGLFSMFIPILFVGTVYDLGVLFYCFLGIAAGGLRDARLPAAGRTEPVRSGTMEHRSLV